MLNDEDYMSSTEKNNSNLFSKEDLKKFDKLLP
jgi:hypothetical protein